jgi:hypothetical protein
MKMQRLAGSRHGYIPRYATVPARTAIGTVDETKSPRMFWGGRKPSKYDPNTEDAKHAAAAS